MKHQPPTNHNISNLLHEIANLLEAQHANPHRIRAYRQAAGIILQRSEVLADLVYSGDGLALESLPGIGESLARIIIEYVKTGRSQLLQRLMGEVSPEEVFEQVPCIGPCLAARIVETLGIRTLEELEQAAHDGRLLQVAGFGEKRVADTQVSLAGMLGSLARRHTLAFTPVDRRGNLRPTIAALLDVDRNYRLKAAARELKKIAPKRFNPAKEAWLPIYHSERDGWDFTALFSNTARAHELHKTGDWVVIYFEKNGCEDQTTIVTETSGPLAGRRVVRGREVECKSYYNLEGQLEEMSS
jgi:Holliday junction resolvasome RuvABC DNA-binding subunit